MNNISLVVAGLFLFTCLLVGVGLGRGFFFCLFLGVPVFSASIEIFPNMSDIIIFKKPTDPDELIVHRIVEKEERNGKIFFFTKGDGNSNTKWPDIPTSLEYDPWNQGNGISEDLVVGKVVMRIPWVGHFVLFMRNGIGLPLVVGLITILLIVEFIIPIIRSKKEDPQQELLI